MYAMNSDVYTCDFCDFDIAWGATSSTHGAMWECEKCGQHFCTKCFSDRFGVEHFRDMLHNSEKIYCLDCYEKREEAAK